MLQFSNIKKYYNRQLVLQIDELNLQKGEIIGLVGNNGAGKTTMLRLILDLIKSDSGLIINDGFIVSQSEKWKNYTASYLDEGFLIDYLTPEEFINFVCQEYNIKNDELNNKLNTYEKFFNDNIFVNNKKYIRDFSKGNKQKIGIVTSLITDPLLLILDEPFNHLDPTSQILLKKYILDYSKNSNSLIIVSSHDLNHITEISTRIILLENGKIKYDLLNSEDTLSKLEVYFSV